MHHTDLEIDKLHGQVQAAMDAFFAEPLPNKLYLWERLAKRLWSMESQRQNEAIAATGGEHEELQPLWRGPQDVAGVARRPHVTREVA